MSLRRLRWYFIFCFVNLWLCWLRIDRQIEFCFIFQMIYQFGQQIINMQWIAILILVLIPRQNVFHFDYLWSKILRKSTHIFTRINNDLTFEGILFPNFIPWIRQLVTKFLFTRLSKEYKPFTHTFIFLARQLDCGE